MALVLTTQEKKVLGFVLLMVVLGLVMLGVRRILNTHFGPTREAVIVTPTAEPKTP